jgi:chromate reductase
MAGPRSVAVLVGSLRRESLNRKLAMALAALAPSSLQLRIVEIGALPLYDQDQEADPPAAVGDFKRAIAAADAALFVTPEYNRSVPGVLKNAIDHASRPYGESAWQGKPAAVITLSPGALGGFGANHHLRQSLVFLDMPTMAQPEAYVGNGAKLFGDDGSIVVPQTREFLEKFMAAFAAWIERNAAARPQ